MWSSRQTIAALAGLILLLSPVGLSTSCRREKKQQAAEQPKDPVIAIVNGHEVHRSKYETFVRLKEIDLQDHLVPIPEKEIFREFLIDRMLLQAAVKAGVEVSDGELLQQFGLLGEQKKTELGANAEDLRNLLRVEKYVHQKLVGAPKIQVPEMEKYYEDHQAEFVVDDRVHVLEILVSQEKVASELRKQLRPRDFRTFRRIAKEHSEGLTASQAGDLGIFEPGDLPEEFEKVIFRLKPGQVSQIFRSEHGYHIFMVEEFIPKHTQAFHEVQKDIYEKMLAQYERIQLDKYVEDLLKAASIEILDPNLQFDWRKSDATGD
jgi:parvulin-like peptidyl-prolyl isomerase